MINFAAVNQTWPCLVYTVYKQCVYIFIHNETKKVAQSLLGYDQVLHQSNI